MFAAYVTRGVKAGLVAGVAFGLFVALLANPLVAFVDELGHGGHAEAIGDGHGSGVEGGGHHGAAGGEAHGGSAVSSAVTNAVSAVAGVLWGVLLGGVVLGAAFYFLEPAIPGTGGAKSYVLAAAGFVTVSGAPWLALPPVPGAEQALPTATRLQIYGGTMLLGALACALAAVAYGRVTAGRGRWAGVAAALLPFVLLAGPIALLPSNAAGGALPRGLTAGLRGMVVFGQLLLWAVLAATHARLRRSDAGETGVGASIDDATAAAD